jgi:hypothetical protein
VQTKTVMANNAVVVSASDGSLTRKVTLTVTP